ncbi:MAG: restriction endonuclease subunit S [Syntrophobacteraceae bacterium]
MNGSPPGDWPVVPLEDLVEILDAQRVPLNAKVREQRVSGKSINELFPYYGATGQVGYIDDYIFTGPLVLLGEDGVPFLDPLRHKAYRVQKKCWVNNHAHVLRSKSELTNDGYISAFLNAFDYTGYVTGSTRLKLTQAAMRSIPVPIPPLNEQKRIASKLDALLARVNACRERLDHLPIILKRFRQSVLAAATSGQLTEDWRERASTLTSPRFVSLGDVASELSYGSSAKSSPTGSIPVLRMGNIQDGRLDWSELVFTSNAMEINKYALRPGDVLFNRTNSPELVGKTAVYKGERPAIFAGYLIRIRCGNSLLPDYLSYCINSPAGRDFCWRVKSDGVSQSNINAKKLSVFEFELPSTEEQHEIVRRVETLFAFVDRLQTRVATAKAHAESLTPSLLAKAFRGELVPQDPTDEPAWELLKRVRKERLSKTQEHKEGPRPRGSKMKKEREKQRDILAVLREANRPMTPEEVFAACGFDEESVDEFYEHLRKAVGMEQIYESRRGDLVQLEASKK